jgi:hypothetical protein
MDLKVTMLFLIIGTIIGLSNGGGAKLVPHLSRVRATMIASLRGAR